MANPKVTLRKRKLKNGYSYQIDYTIEGKRYRKSAGRKKNAAEEVRDKIQTDITYGNFDILINSPRVIGLNSLINEFFNDKRNNISAKTQNRYKNHFVPFQKFINSFFPKSANNIRLIETRYIKECVNNIVEGKSEQKWKPVTINRMIQLISSLFIYAIKNKYILENPTVGINKLPTPKPDAPKFYSKKDLVQIWNKVDPYWLPMFQFMYYTGIRKGELINLVWEKVSLDNNPTIIRIVSNHEWRSKSGNFNIIPLHPKALAIIKKQIGIHEKYVFTSKSNQKIHPNTILSVLKRTLKKLDIEGHIHKLRHTFASHLIMDKQDPYIIKELLGHSKLESTMIYLHLNPEHKHKVINSLE